jgi:hypothetical protein
LISGAVGPVAVVADMVPGVLIGDGLVGGDVGAERVPLLATLVRGISSGWATDLDFRDVLAASGVSALF